MSNVETGEVESGHVSPAPRKKADSSVLVKGCAIGCGAVGFLAILVVVAVFFFIWPSVSSKMAKAMSEILVADFQTMKDSGKVPEEHAELYQSLVDFTQQPEATSAGVLLVATVVESNLEDGLISESERQEAQEVREFLDANPGAGITAVDAFMGEHEGLKERAQELQTTIMNPAVLLAPKS